MFLEVILGLVGVVFILFYIFTTKENLKNLPPGPKGAIWFGIKVDIPNMHLDQSFYICDLIQGNELSLSEFKSC
jgi:hypothetical protein